MFGSFHVRATEPADLAELGDFLRAGFGDGDDAPHFSDAVMRWKYFTPCDFECGPRSFIARSDGRIVGHVGIVPRMFQVQADPAAPEVAIPALHYIDLLASPTHATAGLMLMKRGFQATEAQYALGGSADGQRMALATGYEHRFEYPVMRSILRPLHRIRGTSDGRLRRWVRVGKDLLDHFAQNERAPHIPVSARGVDSFDAEVDRLFNQASTKIVRTSRSSAMLNAYLKVPSGEMTGWRLYRGSDLIGCALLNVKTADSLRTGKIAECFLASHDVPLWHAALVALKHELRNQQADLAICYATTPWIVEACRMAGFRPAPKRGKFYLRDPKGRIPRDAMFHLTMLEGDHAYF